MSLFGGKKNTPNIEEIIHLILKNEENWLQQVKQRSAELNFIRRFEIIKETLPKLDKVRARDLIRMLMTDKEANLKNKLQDPQDKYTAIECLSYFPSRETVELLAELLGDKHEDVRLCAAGALKNHTPRLVVPNVIRALIKGEVLAARAADVLLAMGYLAEEALLENYPQAAPEVKSQILEILTLAKSPKIRPFLPEALHSGYLPLRKKALEAVEALGFQELWTGVLDGLVENNWSIRAKTLETLGKLGVQESREFVELMLADDDPWVRESAKQCLLVLEKSGLNENRTDMDDNSGCKKEEA